MNKVLKLQRVGLITPTVVEYEGKVLATNHLDIESTCNLWRVHFGFYPREKVDIAMTKKQFLSIQQKTLSSVKSVYDLFYERDFIPRVFEANEEHTEWGMYRNKELEKLEAENAALKERLEKAVELPYKRKRLLWGDKDKETLLCPDCLTDLMGGIGDETFVVQCPNCGCFVDCMVEPIPFTEAAEARLNKCKEGKNENDRRI